MHGIITVFPSLLRSLRLPASPCVVRRGARRREVTRGEEAATWPRSEKQIVSISFGLNLRGFEVFLMLLQNLLVLLGPGEHFSHNQCFCSFDSSCRAVKRSKTTTCTNLCSGIVFSQGKPTPRKHFRKKRPLQLFSKMSIIPTPTRVRAASDAVFLGRR